MIDKDSFLEFAISKFTTFGSKSFTLDDLAHEMRISKKTIYQIFKSKDNLVYESLIFLLEKIESEVSEIIEQQKSDPLQTVIAVYSKGLDYLNTFNPTFLFGLEKYYPKAYKQFITFRTHLDFFYVDEKSR